mmetsp:Transcript_62048/g.195757  ORF Transcript_62048/g.195757 Transcript_62048/m.195757 type:complete len:289 (-) Transcript_62048:544-1410(-)
MTEEQKLRVQLQQVLHVVNDRTQLCLGREAEELGRLPQLCVFSLTTEVRLHSGADNAGAALNLTEQILVHLLGVQGHAHASLGWKLVQDVAFQPPDHNRAPEKIAELGVAPRTAPLLNGLLPEALDLLGAVPLRELHEGRHLCGQERLQLSVEFCGTIQSRCATKQHHPPGSLAEAHHGFGALAPGLLDILRFVHHNNKEIPTIGPGTQLLVAPQHVVGADDNARVDGGPVPTVPDNMHEFAVFANEMRQPLRSLLPPDPAQGGGRNDQQRPLFHILCCQQQGLQRLP